MEWTLENFRTRILLEQWKKSHSGLYIHLKSCYDRHDIASIYQITGLDFRGILREECYRPLIKIEKPKFI